MGVAMQFHVSATIRPTKVPHLLWVAGATKGKRHAYPVSTVPLALCGAGFLPADRMAGDSDCADCRGILRLVSAGLVEA